MVRTKIFEHKMVRSKSNASDSSLNYGFLNPTPGEGQYCQQSVKGPTVWEVVPIRERATDWRTLSQRCSSGDPQSRPLGV